MSRVDGGRKIHPDRPGNLFLYYNLHVALDKWLSDEQRLFAARTTANVRFAIDKEVVAKEAAVAD